MQKIELTVTIRGEKKSVDFFQKVIDKVVDLYNQTNEDLVFVSIRRSMKLSLKKAEKHG